MCFTLSKVRTDEETKVYITIGSQLTQIYNNRDLEKLKLQNNTSCRASVVNTNE